VNALLLLLAAAPAAWAQEFTIDQLVAAALERAPAIRAARLDVAAAQGQLTQAGLRANPIVTGSRMEQTGGTDNRTLMEVEWPLELFRRSGRETAARQALEVTTLSVRDRERLLAAAVREQAGRVLAARRTVTIADEALTAARSMRELLERRASEGAVPQLEADLTALEMWRIEADRATAVAEAEVASIELKALAGFAPDAPVTVSGSLEAIARARTEPTDNAPGARPDILEAGARMALAEARIDAARREGRIDLSLYGSYDRTQLGFPQLGLDAQGAHVPIEGVFHNVAVGAMVMVPLWNRNQGAVVAAQAERDAAREVLAAREIEARAEIAAAEARDREARRAVELYAASIRALAQRDADVILEAYELGGIRLTDLLDFQRRYLDIEHAYTAKLLQAYEAHAALRRARGEIQ
jgi:cobalt-zinc-cadmium efflux system outer membrane protein